MMPKMAFNFVPVLQKSPTYPRGYASDFCSPSTSLQVHFEHHVGLSNVAEATVGEAQSQ